MKTIKLLFLLLVLLSPVTLVSAQSGEYQLSTHMLDVSKGSPAEGISITLYKSDPASQQWIQVTSEKTNENGRVANLLPYNQDNTGTYKLKFETAPYFKAQNINSIYPYVEIVFNIEGKGHYHIPITMSANGYSTYRGN